MKQIYDPTLLGLQVVKMMGNEALVFCPFHRDSNASAEYNLHKGVFYCFGCQESRTAEQLADELGGSLVPMGEISEAYSAPIGDDLEWINLLKNPLAIDNKYLRNRLVGSGQIEKYFIRSNEDGIIFPLKNKFGKTVGIQVRHYERKPKYLFYGKRPPVWPLSALYGATTVYITEGVFGALRAERAGQKAVAMMGAGTVKSTAEYLTSFGQLRPVAVMDNDYAGLLAAGKFILMGIPAVVYDLTNQPDEWSFEDWKYVNFTHQDTLDVNVIIEKSEEPGKLQRTLEKFWRKL